MNRWVSRSFCAAGACLCLMLSFSAVAASAEDKRRELSSLRDQIHSLQQDIDRGEAHQGAASDELARSDKSIAAIQKRLRDLRARRGQIEGELSRLEKQRMVLDGQIAELRKQVGDTLFRTYVEGGEAGVRRFLSGDNPNQISRDAYYLEVIARRRMQAIEQARDAVQVLEKVRSDSQQKRGQLADLEKQQSAEQEGLVKERARQRAALGQIASKLQDQRARMVSLQHNEARLQKLIQGLEEIARAMAERKAREQAARENSGKKAAPEHDGRHESPRSREPVTGKADNVAQADRENLPFSARRGHLHWPVKGELIGRFGAPRVEGATTWRGVFIRAKSGTDVHAVAAGKVVFADWMRGFGNLIIVEHGGGYMTVYGNNDSVFKSPGDDVAAGDVIAAVGTSGGQEDSGLYFEIRYRGQPQDPAKWVAK